MTIKTFRPGKISDPEAGKSSGVDITSLYKKKAKYHGWKDLSNLKKKNGVAQCGWDDGSCNHSTHYGIGGYHNICPIGGVNGDYPWPAELKLSNFNFGINSAAKIKSVTVKFEHRMIGINTGSGSKSDNWGPTFHGNWVNKVFFTNGDTKVSSTAQSNNNPKLSLSRFSSFSHKFTDITAAELVKSNFTLHIRYNYNHNTNPGAIYIRNITVEVEYIDADKYITASNSSESLFCNNEDGCCTTINQTVEAGYISGGKKIAPNKAPAKLGSEIQCIEAPTGVSVNYVPNSQSDTSKTFQIVDKTNIEGWKTVTYNLSNDASKSVTIGYNAYLRPRPSYSFVTEYKSNEDFDSNKSYIVFKNGCASNISIYIDSTNSTPLVLDVANQNSSVNLLNVDAIRTFHDKIKTLSCGYHTLYIKRGNESIVDAQKNKVTIKISPMNFKFNIYTEENENQELEFDQVKGTKSEYNKNRYSTIIFERIDDEPQAIIPSVNIMDETQPSLVTNKTNIAKGDKITHQIDKYYSGEYFVSIQDNNPCKGKPNKALVKINSTHKQNYDYLFTRGEKGTSFDFDYLVAWEGDNIKEPLNIGSIELKHSPDDLRICSNSVQSGLSQIGLIELNIRNKTDELLEGIEIELNTLVENDNGKKEITTSEWTNTDGIFNQFYTLFYDYNISLGKNVEVLNLTPDNDLIDEENVYLLINQLEANDTINIKLPFRSTTEKTVFLQYLLFEDPLPINTIENCGNINNDIDETLCPNEDGKRTCIQVDVIDSMLTKLEISGNTDLLRLDTESFDCPDECYTTKNTDDDYKPLSGEDNKKTGGITYKITNIDTNNFDTQLSKTEIINSNELIPYGYIIHDEYYALLDNNNNPIQVQENRPLLDEKGNQRYDVKTDADGNLILDENGNIQYDETKPLYESNRLMWTQEEETINKIMAGQNVVCTVQFPNNDKIEYVIKTNKKGLAEFFIPIPKSLNMTYTVEELLTNVLAFIFKEQDEYNEAIQTKQEGFTHKIPDPNKAIVNIDYGNNFKRYKPGEIAYIPVFLSANIKIIKNHFTFYAELKNTGDSDEVTILYKACNLNNNEGILKTTFKTNDKKLTPNSISKNIYCGLMSELDLNVNIEKNIVELQDLNVLYINVLNQKKENKNVEVQISLEKIPTKYLGNYNFIDIDIESGDYSIIEENNNLYINWLIGSMESFEKQKGIIKIQAKEIGLSNINIEVFDYLHKKDGTTINVKQSECSRCENNNSWVVADTQWKQFDGIWYKKFSDGIYRKPATIVLENGQYSRKWVDKV